MHIYVVDANGGSPRRLTDDQTGGVVPRWSRDGACDLLFVVAFGHKRDLEDPERRRRAGSE